MTLAAFLGEHAAESVCWLQTTGRRSGRPRTIEIWFATDGRSLYFLSGGRDRAHWVRNLRADPRVRVRLAGRTFGGRATVIEGKGDDATARQLLATKYQGWSEGRPMSSWAAESLPVRVDPDPA